MKIDETIASFVGRKYEYKIEKNKISIQFNSTKIRF